MSGMLNELRFNTDKMLSDAKNTYSNAIDLADWLVQKLGKPFREAHKISGKLVKLAEKKNLNLEELSLLDFQTAEPGITNDIFSYLDIQKAIEKRQSYGGPAPKNVKSACAKARRKYLN